MTLIEMRSISKWYRVGEQGVGALQELDLEIDRGEMVAVMGPSGSGKSTLMNLMGCLDVPSSGAYVLDGVTTSELGDRRLAEVRNREIGFVFQGFHLLATATARENVELPLAYARVRRRNRRNQAERALERVGLGERMEHRATELSGGQCQRVAIARALVNRPSILLADEPTGNLDSAASEEILGIFDAVHRQGTTVVLVTHDPGVADRAQRTVTLYDGRLISDTSRPP